MNRADLAWSHHQVGAPPPKMHPLTRKPRDRNVAMTITLTHAPSGATVTSAPVRRFSRQYWETRNALYAQLSHLVSTHK